MGVNDHATMKVQVPGTAFRFVRSMLNGEHESPATNRGVVFFFNLVLIMETPLEIQDSSVNHLD